MLRAIGQKEEVEVSDTDIQERVEVLAGQINLTPENIIKYYVSKDGSLDGLKSSIYEDKVLDLLVEKAIKEPMKDKKPKDDKPKDDKSEDK